MKLDLFTIALLLGTSQAVKYWTKDGDQTSGDATKAIIDGNNYLIAKPDEMIAAFNVKSAVIDANPFDNVLNFMNEIDKIIKDAVAMDSVLALTKFCESNDRKEYFRFIDKAHVQRIISSFKSDAKDMAPFFGLLDPKAVSSVDASVLTAAILKGVLTEAKTKTIKIEARFFDGLGRDFIEKDEYAQAIADYLSDGNIHEVTTGTFKSIVSKPKSAKHFKAVDINNILKNPAMAKYLTEDVFEEIVEDELKAAKPGKSVRNLHSEAFAKVRQRMGEDFYRNMDASLAKNFQRHTDIKEHPDRVRIRADLLDYRVVEHLNPDVWVAIFSGKANQSKDEVDAMKSWKYWRRIPDSTFRLIVKKHALHTVLTKSSYAALSKAQRTMILSEYGTSDGPGCGKLSKFLFEGTERRTLGLELSKECFDQLKKDKKLAMRFNAVRKGMVKPEYLKEITADEISQLKTTVLKDKKKEKSIVLEGVLCLNNLRNLPKGVEMIQSIFDKDNDNVLKSCEKISDIKALKYAAWLQPLLPHGCIRRIPPGTFKFKTAQKLNPEVWSHLNKKQIEEMISGESNWKKIGGPWIAGLARNKTFAKMATYRTEKSDAKEDAAEEDKYTKTLLQHISDEVLKEHFGAEFVKLVPKDKDHLPGLLQALPHLNSSALAAMDNKWIRSQWADPEKIPEELFGSAGTDLPDAESYSASLSSAEVSKMSETRFSKASPKFVSQLSTSALGALSTAQVKHIPAESLCLLCGDKAKALKAELSEEQRKSLGSKCAAATPDSMAPCPYSMGGMLTLAAAAAGSAILML